MPADNSFRSDDDDRVLPVRPQSKFIQVTGYAAWRYLADFKAGWSFGEGQVYNRFNEQVFWGGKSGR